MRYVTIVKQPDYCAQAVYRHSKGGVRSNALLTGGWLCCALSVVTEEREIGTEEVVAMVC